MTDTNYARGYFAGWSDAKKGRAYGESAGKEPEMEGYSICDEPTHNGSVWSDRLQALLCPHTHERPYYAKQYNRD